MDKALVVGKSKTEAGERVIPLNRDAWNTILLLYECAKKLGVVQSDSYVFPACEGSNVDPKHAIKSWRTAWRNLTRQISCPGCGTKQQPANPARTRSALQTLRLRAPRRAAIPRLAAPCHN